MAGIERVKWERANFTASGRNVRSERSPLHDVRQHATRKRPLEGAHGVRGFIFHGRDFKLDSPPTPLRASARQPSRHLGSPSRSRGAAKAGGARRDRTDDLLLAKQALSQLSYGPAGSGTQAEAGIGGPGKI